MVELRVLASDDDWPVWRQARPAALSEAPHAFKARLADWPHGGEDRWRAGVVEAWARRAGARALRLAMVPGTRRRLPCTGGTGSSPRGSSERCWGTG